MSDGMGREFTYPSSHATNRYFIPNWGILLQKISRITRVRFFSIKPNGLFRMLTKKHRTPIWWSILRLWLQKNRPFAIISIPPSPPPNINIPYWSCPLWTPSLTLPPSSLKCWQKSNPNIHRQCFRCFKCFGCFRCFISLLDHKTAPFWSKSEQSRKIVTIQLCNNIIKI